MKIGYLNIPSFYVSVERALDPSFKSKAVAIAPLNSDRAKVWSVSSEARKCGVYKGLPVAVARKLCKGIIIVPPSPSKYQRANRKIFEKFQKSLPLFEMEREGKFYFDFKGMHNIYGDIQDFSNRVKKEVLFDLKLHSSVGLGTSKLISKTAAKSISLENNIFKVDSGKEELFLSPFPNDILPPIKEYKMNSALESNSLFDMLNLDFVSDIQPLSKAQLEIPFEGKAETIYEMSHGIDFREVIPFNQKATIFEDLIFAQDTNHFIKIKSGLYELILKACQRLKKINKHSRKMKIAIRYSDYKYIMKEKNFKHFVQLPYEIEKIAYQVLDSLLKRRTTVRSISLELIELASVETQLSFLQDNHEAKVNLIFDSINERFQERLKMGSIYKV